MRGIIKKIQIITFSASLSFAFLLPLIHASDVSAAATPGECVLASNQGQVVEGVNTCKTFIPSGIDADGTKLDSQKCYELYEVRGSVSIRKELLCSNSRLTSPKQYICANTSPAPNNDPSKCTAGSGVTTTCSDGKVLKPGETCPAVGDAAAQGGNCSNGLSNCDLMVKYIYPLINFLAALVGLAVTISLVIGGIQYGSSAGDPQKITAAKNRIRNAIIALVTFIFLYALLNFLVPGGLLK